MNENNPSRVLVIDDDRAVCDIIVEVVQGIGCDAQSSVEKNDILRNIGLNWDCIVVDLTMPDLDGIEVLRLLAQNESRASIILISGFSKGMLSSARRLGEVRGLNIVEALTKPIDIDVLETVVAAALASNGTPAAIDHETPDMFLNWTDADVNHGGVIAYYQPKIDLRTGGLAGFEALARWWHPQRGILPPSAFIPQAIEQGRIDEITMTMAERVASDIEVWSERGNAPMVSINVEAGSLADLELPGRIEATLKRYGVDPDYLILEVTESGVVEDIADAMDNLIRFRVKGYALSIDDFGTGHSTLSQLHDLPFNQLKIDRSFVSGIGQSDQAEAIVASTIDLAHRLDLEVVAEGVESNEQIYFLRSHGCDQLQGFYFAKPMNAADICQWQRQQSDPIYTAA